MIIFLNGTTSSGKSTLARALQRIIDQPYIHASADAIKEMSANIPPPEQGDAFARSSFMPQLYAAIPSCFAALAATGSRLIIDDVARPLQLRSYTEVFAHDTVYLVGVHCSLEELERRESARGNRCAGRAREQLHQGLIHAIGIYDAEVDTSQQPADSCALLIRRHLESGIQPSALKRIAQLPLESLWSMTDDMDRSIYRAGHSETFEPRAPRPTPIE